MRDLQVVLRGYHFEWVAALSYEAAVRIQEAVRATDSHMQGRRIELDFIRGIAILAVMGHHFATIKANWWVLDGLDLTFRNFGHEGVNLFFTLSGFLVGGLLLRQMAEHGSIDAWRFIVRRIFKIWPAYYALLLFHLVVGRHPANTFFLQNALHIQNYVGTSIVQTWSLAVEEHFYLLLPPGLMIAARLRMGSSALIRLLVTVCAVVLVARCIAVFHGELREAFAYTQYRIDSLLSGVILAAFYWLKPRAYATLAARLGALILAIVATVAWIVFARHRPDLDASIGYTIQSIGFCALIVLVREHSGRLVHTPIYRGVGWLGVYSYGIYLWHSLALAPGQSVINFGLHAAWPPVLIWTAALFVQAFIGIGAGYITTRAIELPFLRIRDAAFPAKARPSVATLSADDESRKPAEAT